MNENQKDLSLDFSQWDTSEIAQTLNEIKQLYGEGKALTAFDVIAHLLEFRPLPNNLYLSPKGKKYVKTKYGFQPVEVFNKGIELKKAYQTIQTLETQVKELDQTNKNLSDELLQHQQGSIFKAQAYEEEIQFLKRKVNRLNTENTALRLENKDLLIEIREKEELFKKFSKQKYALKALIDEIPD